MNRYTVNSKKGRFFQIVSDIEKLCDITYEKWTNREAEVSMYTGEKFVITAEKIFSKKIEVKQEEKVIATIAPCSKDVLKICLEDGSHYFFKKSEINKAAYVIASVDDKELVAIEQEFKWKTLSFKSILYTNQNDVPFILLPICVYCANIQKSSFVGVASFMSNSST